jgi:hypothetical protein
VTEGERRKAVPTERNIRAQTRACRSPAQLGGLVAWEWGPELKGYLAPGLVTLHFITQQILRGKSLVHWS